MPFGPWGRRNPVYGRDSKRFAYEYKDFIVGWFRLNGHRKRQVAFADRRFAVLPIEPELMMVAASLQLVSVLQRADEFVVVAPKWPPLDALHRTTLRLPSPWKILKLKCDRFVPSDKKRCRPKLESLDGYAVNVQRGDQHKPLTVPLLPARLTGKGLFGVVEYAEVGCIQPI